ncbi:MAG: PAS domain S-box protein [Xanthomonadales bacterium]|nr:PAS domain S-box protein [Xanthomonadales bacterium]MDH4020989.1 PAS domain S-box protein [Xanthomonadales bacterium]
MPEPQRSQHDNYLRNYLETGVAKVIGIGREVVGRRNDGSRFPVDLAVTELHLPGKHLFTGIIRDISDRKRARRQAEQSRIDLEHVRRQTIWHRLSLFLRDTFLPVLSPV